MDRIEQVNLEKLKKGNKECLYFFHEKYHEKVYHYSYTFVKNKEVAEEITSDVFVRIWKIRDRVDISKGIDHLMFKITKNFCIDYLRKVSRNSALREDYLRQCMASRSTIIEEQYSFREHLAIAKQAIAKLPPKCRKVFLLRYDQELSLQQIAGELDIAVSTVQKHLHKGTKFVRNYIKSHTDLVFLALIYNALLFF